jgi:hypothetical protein
MKQDTERDFHRPSLTKVKYTSFYAKNTTLQTKFIGLPTRRDNKCGHATKSQSEAERILPK